MTTRNSHRITLGADGYPMLYGHDARDSDLDRQDPPRRKHDHRYSYSYDPFTIWGHAGPNERCNGSEYTDRLWELDYNKAEQLSARIYAGARPFDNHACRGELIQLFLREWFDDPEIELLRVVEYCNVSTGYPTWRLDYYSPKAEARERQRRMRQRAKEQS